MEIQSLQDWFATYIDLRQRILSLSNPKAQMDLFRILRTVEALATELSKEEVECRRLHRQTAKHKELIIKINKHINFLDQTITFGALAT